MTFDGRIEAQIAIPAGTTLHASNVSDDVTYTIPAGSYYMTGLLSTIAAGINALAVTSPNWSASMSTGVSGTGRVSFGHSALTWNLAFSTNLPSLFGFSGVTPAAPPGNQPGTAQARGVWIPDCPLFCDSDPRRAPKFTDQRQTMGPTGSVRTLVGTVYYKHTNVTWQRVVNAKIREAAAVYANASWEHFLDETQYGGGLSFFTPGSLVQIYDHSGIQLGSDRNTTMGWSIVGVKDIDPRRPDASGWCGQSTVTIPTLISSG